MTAWARKVEFDADTIWVSLEDGRTLGVPLAWFPRLMAADAAALAQVEISAFGLHWEALDEDISVSALLEGEVGQVAT